MTNIVEIKKYDPEFPDIFQKEKKRLTQILSAIDTNFEVEHIGSTAIPGLDGKGVIDIMIVLDDFSQKGSILSALIDSGLYFKKTAGSEGRIFLSDADLSSDKVRFHYHIVAKNSIDHKEPIIFRDELAKDPAKVKEYLILKLELARKSKGPREYLEGKESFIQKVIERSKNN